MLMAVLEGRAPNRRPQHAVEVGVTPCRQQRNRSAWIAVGGPKGSFFYVHRIITGGHVYAYVLTVLSDGYGFAFGSATVLHYRLLNRRCMA